MSEFGSGINQEAAETRTGFLTSDEYQAIITQADIRQRAQEFKVNLLNLQLSESAPLHREKYEQNLALVRREADGNLTTSKEQAEQYLREREEDAREKADFMQDIAPNFSAYLLANLAKQEQMAGQEYRPTLAVASQVQEKMDHLLKLAPSDMLSDAVILGIERRSATGLSMPSMEKIAQEVTSSPELLERYALVLEEKQREKFLSLFPEEQRRSISNSLDIAASRVLHGSLIEKGTPEEEQRRQVRMRLFNEIRTALNNPSSSEVQMAKMIGSALGELGEDSRQLLLELIRDESQQRNDDLDRPAGHLPRIMKVMLDNFNDWRANDIILRTAAESNLNKHLSIYLFGKLVERGYLPDDVAHWWQGRREAAAKQNRSTEDENYRLAALQKVVGELGVIPSAQVMMFITDDARWQENGQAIGLDGRIVRIQESQAEFTNVQSNIELCQLLIGDENKAMTYYLLYGGQDRFNLINNYEFGKFWEMVNLIANPRFAEKQNLTPLEVHEEPVRRFAQTLANGGLTNNEIEPVVANLRSGHFPLTDRGQSYQEVSFESSESAALNNANAEIGQVLGREQLGVTLLFPLYRDYLERDPGEDAQAFTARLQTTTTFADRLALIAEIESQFPDFRDRAKNELQEPWLKFGEKMVIELTLDQVFSGVQVSIKGNELLPKLDAKRIDLKRINKELLALLKGENKAIADIGKEISGKKKARQNLALGLEKQQDDARRQNLEQKIATIEEEIQRLEARRASLGEVRADERFADLSPQEKQAEIDHLSQELIALTEKSPSAIFTYITMQVLGEERLRESDIALVKEMESHLQGPLQTISDFLTYDRTQSSRRKQSKVGLRYLDKTDRLMTMVRFADSKICCFSSSNYEMRVQHDTPNKFWVASINADPMSFVFSIEQPQPQATEFETDRQINENIGFIFGNFGIDDNGELAILLNGIYYAPGIEDEHQVSSILGGVEEIFAGLPIKTVAVATQYGGSVKMPPEFSSQPIELTRLRAIDDGTGRPENHIYDDLGTGADLNRPHYYQGSVWHKRI